MLLLMLLPWVKLRGVSSGDSGSFRIRNERGAFAAPTFEFQACRDPAREQRSTQATQQVVSSDRLRRTRVALKMNLIFTFNERAWECVDHRLSWLHPNLLQ
jgi:hypothetical protein